MRRILWAELLKGSTFLDIFCSSRMRVTPLSAQVMHNLPWLAHSNKWQTEAKSACLHLVSHLVLFCLPRLYSTVASLSFCNGQNLGNARRTIAFLVQCPKYKCSFEDVLSSIFQFYSVATPWFLCVALCAQYIKHLCHEGFLAPCSWSGAH